MRPKSKKTLYCDVLYRSRIEAQWAVFYDALGIKHRYEPFWSEIDSRRGCINYLPDFEIFIPNENHSYYVEIKDSIPSDEAITKACGWAREYGDVLILFDLRPPKINSESGWLFEWSEISDHVHKSKNMWWCECPTCGYLGLQNNGEPPCKCNSETNIAIMQEWDEVFGSDLSLCSTRTPKLLAAYEKARKYKF